MVTRDARGRGLRSLAFLAALLAAACDVAPRGHSAEPGATARSAPDPGRLVLVGGALRDDNAPVYDAILAARRDGPVCVLPTASADPSRSLRAHVEAFERHGGPGAALGIVLTEDDPDRARGKEIPRRLRRCGGYFFTGGSQSRIARVFLPGGEDTPAYRAIRDRFRAGAVVSGSSAGAAVLGDPMIAGGSSAGALAYGVRLTSDGRGVWLRRGFGFFGWGIVDQHFLARGRLGRLVVAVTGPEGERWGFGVDENTALVVDGAEAVVVGESGVVWVDGREREAPGDPVRERGVVLTLLGRGDRVDLGRGRAEVAEGKGPLGSRAGELGPPADPFARWAFLGLLADFAASDRSRLSFGAAGHRFELTKGEGFRARSLSGEGVRGTPPGLFAGPLRLLLSREEPTS